MLSAEAVLALLAKQKAEFEAILKERDAQAAEREKQAAAAVAAKKHELGRTNPLLFPPHLYTKEVLQINQPFLFFSRKRLAGDKSRVKMDEDVLLYVISRALVGDLAKAHKLYKEIPLRSLHLSLLSGFFELTRPSFAAQEELKRFTEMFTRQTTDDEDDHVEYESECYSATAPESCNTSREEDDTDDVALFLGDVSDDNVESEEEEKEAAVEKPLQGSSIDSISLEHEIQRHDIAVKVYDRVRGCWVTVCVIEGKEPLTRDALSQALRYACAEGLINLEHGRVAPIYVMAWSASMWSYGMLDIYGAVSIQNGKVHMADFEAHQELRWKILRKSGDFALNSKFTVEELSRKMERSKLHLKRRYEGKADYKDGAYLVANVYIANENYVLPSVWDVRSPSAMLFYEMLLRIIVGERVIKWTQKDVDDAYSVRKDMHESRCKLLTTGKRRKICSS